MGTLQGSSASRWGTLADYSEDIGRDSIHPDARQLAVWYSIWCFRRYVLCRNLNCVGIIGSMPNKPRWVRCRNGPSYRWLQLIRYIDPIFFYTNFESSTANPQLHVIIGRASEQPLKLFKVNAPAQGNGSPSLLFFAEPDGKQRSVLRCSICRIYL
jgi:hypothetical protein